MSQDIQIAFPCPHLAIEERVGLDINKQAMLIRRPLAAMGLVQVLANDRYFVPSTGLHSKAKLTGGSRGPFQVLPGENVFTIQTMFSSVTVTLPTGTRVSSSAVVAAINAALGPDTPIVVTRSEGRILIEETKRQGQESRILVGGSAADQIGFQHQRGARGQEVIPGWEPVKIDDPFPTEGAETVRGLRFRKPVKGNWFFKVTYSMASSTCSRCLGTLIENDWRTDQNTNDVITVTDENLLVQASQKILLTTIQSNPFHLWYGTTLQQRIGSKSTGGTAAAIQEDARRALENFQSLQRQQARYQKVSPEEQMYSIESLRVFPFRNSPVAFTLDVVVRNASNKPVNVSIVYTVPGTVALTGTNQQSLGAGGKGIPAFLADLALGG